MSNPFAPNRSSNRNDICEAYGRPLPGSLTELRGKIANFSVSKEILQLCEIIDSQGLPNEFNPQLKMILFGELFDIYNYISNKLVGILLRARKHGLLHFEGEMLFQRRDDNVPIYMLRTLKEIHEFQRMLDERIEEERVNSSGPALPTTVIMDRMQQQQVLPKTHRH